MKYIIFGISVILCLIQIFAQSVCRGYVRSVDQTCEGAKDEGHWFGTVCNQNSNNGMWYYEQRNGTCLEMVYFGCGGNTNRYCNLNDCQRKCERRD